MGWFRVHLTEEEERVVAAERRDHPHEPTRRKMEVLWLLHHGLTREKVAKIVGIGVPTVKRYANAFRDGGLDGLRRWEKKGRTGSLEAHRELLAEESRQRPLSSVTEARRGSADSVNARGKHQRQQKQLRQWHQGAREGAIHSALEGHERNRFPSNGTKD